MIKSILASKCPKFPVYVLRAIVADEVDWNAMASTNISLQAVITPAVL